MKQLLLTCLTAVAMMVAFTSCSKEKDLPEPQVQSQTTPTIASVLNVVGDWKPVEVTYFVDSLTGPDSTWSSLFSPSTTTFYRYTASGDYSLHVNGNNPGTIGSYTVTSNTVTVIYPASTTTYSAWAAGNNILFLQRGVNDQDGNMVTVTNKYSKL